MAQDIIREEPARASLIYDPKVRGIFFQVVLMAALALGLWWIVGNTIENLHRSHIATGFGFLRGRAGFDISNTLIDYSSDSSYGDALVVGVLNTIIVAVAGIITATIVGFLVGIGRLSKNWLIRKLATVYIEIFRNIPPLLVILFWYQGVLALLPNVRDSYSLPFGSYLNNRGFYFPRFVWGEGSWLVLAGLVLGVALSWYVARRARARQMATGQQFPVFWTSVALIVGLPLLAFMLTGGQVADCTAGAALLERLPDCDILHADKGYDANTIRRHVEERGAMPNIPPKANRKWKNCFSPFLYRNRNAIERMFCRLKDFRRIVTRYDRNAANFLAAVCIAATVSYWI